jgi:adenine deaminase
MLAMAAATQSATVDREVIVNPFQSQSLGVERAGDDADLVVINDVDAMTGNAEFVGIEL